MMEERELKEWKWREEQVEKMQEERLELIRIALAERDQRMEKVVRLLDRRVWW
jgi:hypothetical protein